MPRTTGRLPKTFSKTRFPGCVLLAAHVAPPTTTKSPIKIVQMFEPMKSPMPRTICEKLRRIDAAVCEDVRQFRQSKSDKKSHNGYRSAHEDDRIDECRPHPANELGVFLERVAQVFKGFFQIPGRLGGLHKVDESRRKNLLDVLQTPRRTAGRCSRFSRTSRRKFCTAGLSKSAIKILMAETNPFPL